MELKLGELANCCSKIFEALSIWGVVSGSEALDSNDTDKVSSKSPSEVDCMLSMRSSDAWVAPVLHQRLVLVP